MTRGEGIEQILAGEVRQLEQRRARERDRVENDRQQARADRERRKSSNS